MRHITTGRMWAVTGLLLLAAPLIPTQATAERFAFVERRTEVRFVYIMANSTQRGRFTKVSGTLDFDANAPEKSMVSASIATASLTTGEAIIDDELKGAEFFNVAAAPVITFKSRGVRPSGPDKATMAGDITVNGITKPVTLAVSLRPHDDPALRHDAGQHAFHATTRIKRSAFKMTGWKYLVDDEVGIEIDAIVRPGK